MKFIFNNDKITILKTADEEIWNTLISESKPSENDLKDSFANAVEETQNNIDMKKLEDGFKNKDTNKIEDAIPYDSFMNQMDKIGPFLVGAYLYGSMSGKKNSPEEIRNLDYNLNIQDERTLKWIKESTGDLIKEVTKETKNAVREVINRAYKRGEGPDVASEHIKKLVGLTSRQSLAVDNYMNKLIADGSAPKDAQAKAYKYAQRLRNNRAQTIARTELMKAMNTGYLDFIDGAINKGLIKESEYEKVWWTARDERVCPICGPLHGKSVKPKDTFHTPVGDLRGGNAHINCRCIVVIKKS